MFSPVNTEPDHKPLANNDSCNIQSLNQKDSAEPNLLSLMPGKQQSLVVPRPSALKKT